MNEQGTCDVRKGEHPDPMKRICDAPTMFRYQARGGGWMLLCEHHGVIHRSYAERWNGEQWQRP